MSATYRCAPRCFLTGVLVFVVSVAMGIVCPFAVRDAKEAEKLPAGLGTGAASLVLFVLAAAVFRYARRHRLTLADTHVEAIGVWGAKRIALNEVVRLRWRRMGEKGTVTLAGPGGKLTIDLGHYAPGDLREAVRFFRRRLPAAIQEGWSTFWPQYYRLFDEPDPARREAFAAETRALRWRLFAWCFAATLLLGPIGFVVWRRTGDATGLPWLGLMLVPWLSIFFARADRGRVREKHGVRLKANPLIVAAFTVFLLTPVVFLPLLLGGHDGRWILMLGAVSSAALLGLGLGIQAKRLTRARQAAAEEAERLYLHSPAGGAALTETRR